ncbi:MAG: hypothetical protein G01um10142_188 [Parcubacteria group bacterium Gr01-1014_2]|nr:MAG: hypothetical protein G01um10142_188 [Parcubacteria group bacterium Gr01-1014_2]
MFSNKWVVLAVIIVVALVVWNLWEFKGQEKAMQTPQATVSLLPQSGGSTLGGSTSGGGTSFTQTQIQTYSVAVAQYEGRRIQFDERCQAEPVEVTYKNGTSIMIDNRSPQEKTIKVGDQSYNLPAYGYRILTLSSSTLPNSLSLNCGNAVNVGRILLQASILQQ